MKLITIHLLKKITFEQFLKNKKSLSILDLIWKSVSFFRSSRVPLTRTAQKSVCLILCYHHGKNFCRWLALIMWLPASPSEVLRGKQHFESQHSLIRGESELNRPWGSTPCLTYLCTTHISWHWYFWRALVRCQLFGQCLRLQDPDRQDWLELPDGWTFFYKQAWVAGITLSDRGFFSGRGDLHAAFIYLCSGGSFCDDLKWGCRVRPMFFRLVTFCLWRSFWGVIFYNAEKYSLYSSSLHGIVQLNRIKETLSGIGKGFLLIQSNLTVKFLILNPV